MNFKLFLALILGLNGFMAVNLWRLSPGLKVEALNIGQGDALLITTAEEHHILVDGGPDSTVLTELGAALPPAFRELDLVVLTHPHLDHLAGLVPVLQRFEVKALLLGGSAYDSEAYDFFLQEVEAFDGAIYFAEATTDFRLGSSTIDVIYPFKKEVGQEFEEINNSSVVLRVEDGEGHSVLLTGDAEKEVEAELVQAWAEGRVDLDADVLKAGHHGSESSSIPEFLEAVDAEWMLISCGVDNSYGHPHSVTLDKAAALGMEVFRTDLEGRISVVFETPGDGVWARFYSWTRSILAPSERSFSSSRS
ncbi:MBL fold metallo-hydrolase [Candidatus Peregrinibacteria bacterium]|nr:MAG: MBL fold metallo-hydrolase [Candidatus Peregrinibacteria bacterium]